MAAQYVNFGRNVSGSSLATSVVAEHRTEYTRYRAGAVINALVLRNLCEYRIKSYNAKNYVLGATFPLKTLYVYLEPLRRNMKANSMK